MNKRTFFVSLMILLAIGITAFSFFYDIAINRTNSLDGTLFLITKDTVPDQKNQLVAFYPPKNPYYNMPFIKIVGGKQGDLIEVKDRRFHINDTYLVTAKSISKTGKPLSLGNTGVIPPNTYFVYSPHKDGYDSRYKDIGWIHADNIIGVASLIF